MMKKTQLFLVAALCLICLFDTQAQDWSTGGNNLDNNDYLGSNANNRDIQFKQLSKHVGKFRGGLLNDDELGYFGVGLWNNYADDPQERLHVKDGYVLFEGLDNFETSGDESRIYLGNTGYVLKSIKGTGLQFDVEGLSGAMTILNTSGNVGIGISNPQVKLDVNGTICSSNLSGGGQQILITDNNGGITVPNPPCDPSSLPFFLGGNVGLDGAGALGFCDDHDLRINTNGITRMTVARYGSVGVNNTPDANIKFSIYSDDVIGFCSSTDFDLGTNDYNYNTKLLITNPNTKALAVINNTDPQNAYDEFVVYGDGVVFARAFEVTSGIFSHPDYVFSDDYKLLPLEELKKYIGKNKHLPNVPSAKEVQEEGAVNLLEMQQINLEKIEELHLYILQLHEEIAQLKNNMR